MSITKTSIKVIRAEVQEALNDVLAKHGLTAELGRISFSHSDFRCKLSASSATEAVAENTDAARLEWDLNAFRYGLKSGDFGKTFIASGKVFTITGLKTSRPKYPINAVDSKGTGYKFPANAVK